MWKYRYRLKEDMEHALAKILQTVNFDDKKEVEQVKILLDEWPKIEADDIQYALPLLSR